MAILMQNKDLSIVLYNKQEKQMLAEKETKQKWLKLAQYMCVAEESIM